MSVFRFSKTEAVWCLKRSITMDMIEWWIEHAGPKPYLLKIRESYDHGYNHGDLSKVSDEDKNELHDLVRLMLADGYEKRWEGIHVTSRVRAEIIELERLLSVDLEGTHFAHRREE